MTWISGLKITVLVGYAATRFFYRDNVILASVFFGAYSVLLGYFAFDLFRHYRQLGSLEKALAESLRQQLGDKVSRYVLFEVKIIAGAAKLLLSPVSSLRRASQSYFDIVRGLDSGVAKIALSSGPYTRLYFHRQVSARSLFFEKRLDVVDVCLRPGERNAFKKMSADKGER